MTWSLARPLWNMAGYAETAGVQRAAGDISPAADAVLLVRASEGDEQAFSVLVDRHYGFVFRVAVRVLSEAADAEDVAQEAFVRLWRDPGTIDNPAALKGWLARVARNLAIDRIRRTKPTSADERRRARRTAGRCDRSRRPAASRAGRGPGGAGAGAVAGAPTYGAATDLF